MSFSQLFDYHCHDTTSILSSYRSIVLLEKRELSNHGFPDTKLQDFHSQFFPFPFLASSFGLEGKCVSPFLLISLGNIAKFQDV